MPNVPCKECGATFFVKPCWKKAGHGIYCSRTCQYKGRKNGQVKQCFMCKRDVYRSLKYIKKSKSQNFFCSKTCQALWRNSLYTGSLHPNWTTGLYVEYRDILLKTERRQCCQICGESDKRVLCVHHIDSNRKNNVVTNLAWLCYNCHHLVHRHGEKLS
jgi:hypothetical protein